MKTIRSLTCLLLALPTMSWATSYYIETGQTGAQTQIDTAHTSTWDFTPNWGWDLGGGIFTMKDGSQTSGTVTLTLYDLTHSNTVVTSVVLDQTAFTQSFAAITFAFPVAITLTPGINYELDLTSGVANTQNTAYFIKNDGTSSFNDAQGNLLPPAGPVPEPTTFAMSLTAIAGIAFLRRKKVAAPSDRRR